jgi:hypothetical protein
MSKSRALKTLEAMRSNPLDWRIEELEMVARAFAINVRKSGGSHVYFTHPQVPMGISVPARRPIKPVYIRSFVAFVDRVMAA